MEDLIDCAVFLAVLAVFYKLNQWLVNRKELDPRPYVAPSCWGPLGTLIIILARPVGWRKPHRR